LIAQASQEIRTMSHLLHPPLLDEVGLESALRWYVDGFAERSKIAVQVRIQAGFGEGLSRDIALSLFRVVQECLANVHRHSASTTAVVEIVRSAEEIKLVVEDHGKGVPPELQAALFRGEGSGVGLRGMQERMRQFGGRLDIYSDHSGTRVVATLPAPSRDSVEFVFSAGEGDPMSSQNEGSDDHATILCIDDEAEGLVPRRLLLESAGYRVLEARSGEEGIRQFRSNKIDVVILEYWMSGMKGTTVASELKRINPSVPIIVLSGMPDLPGEATGLIDQWLVKGSHRAEHLLKSISNLLERRPA
jgi:CheY-like chemotaxis protein